MPLIKSGSKEAFSSNVGEMIKAGHPRDQALAAAYANARKFASGGMMSTPWYARSEARSLVHDGMLHSPVPGRTDKLPIGVSSGSYVLPADHVSALGQNNSAAGANILNRMFKMGPYGAPAGRLGGGRPNIPKLGKFAAGGATDKVPIVAAGGEFIVPPEKVAEIGGGDIDVGHRILDRWVETTRKKHIKTLRKLPGPKKS